MSLPKHSEVKGAIVNHNYFEPDLMFFKKIFIQDYKKLRDYAEENPQLLPKVYNQNSMVFNVQEGNPYIIFMKNALPLSTCRRVFRIIDNWYSDKRNAVHFGVWGKYQNLLYNISEGLSGDNPTLENLLRNNSDLYLRGERLLEMWLPILHRHLLNAVEQVGIVKTFAGFPAMAINKCKAGSRAADLHYDTEDSGLSMLFCFGSFTGTHLRFPEINIELDFEPGDVIFFKGNLLKHGIAAFTGERYSVVFFMHHMVDYPNDRPYYNLKCGESKKEYVKQGSPQVYPTVIKGKRMPRQRKSNNNNELKKDNKKRAPRNKSTNNEQQGKKKKFK